MGRGKHARQRKAQELFRKAGSRPPYSRLLIVCEGAKTEPNYFNEIRRINRVPSAHVQIVHGNVTEPRQIVDYAENAFSLSREFDVVYAVFDRDVHLTFSNALIRANALDKTLINDEEKTIRFFAIPSVPCFELWLVLHYQDFFSFFDRHEPIQRIRNHIPNYEKSMPNAYEVTRPNLAEAIQRASSLKRRFEPPTGTEPYTLVH